MSIDLSKAVYIEKTDSYVTAKGIITFSAVKKKWQTKKDKEKGQEGQFALTLIVPPKSDLAALRKCCEAAALKEFGKASLVGLKTPFHRAEEKIEDERRPEGFDPNGWTMIRANTYQERPKIIFANGATVPEDEILDEVYNGRWARMSVRPKAYDNEGKGVKFYLQNIQLLEEGEKWPGGGGGRTSAEDEFSAVDTGGGSADSVFGGSKSKPKGWDDDEIPF